MKKYEIGGVLFFTVQDFLVFYADKEHEAESAGAINKQMAVIVNELGDISDKSILYCNHQFVYKAVVVDEKSCFVGFLSFHSTNLNEVMKKITSHNEMNVESQIVEAAIDYKQGCDNSGFADEFGGLCHLKDHLFLLIDRYQSFDNQYVGRKS